MWERRDLRGWAEWEKHSRGRAYPFCAIVPDCNYSLTRDRSSCSGARNRLRVVATIP